MTTQLKELKKEYMKSIKPNNKSSSPRKSPKVESPKSSTMKKRIRDAQLQPRIVSPRPNYDYINEPNDYNNLSLINPYDMTLYAPKINSKPQRKYREQLEPVITQSHGTHLINGKQKLPPIIRKGGKKRTRKNKSNRRRTLRKK